MADLPVAAIVCIAVGLYVAVIIAIVIICHVLKGRGRCGESTCCAKDEDAQSCQCCISIAESCNCCKGPSLNSCLDTCCNRKRISCVDVLLCKCCSSDGSSWVDCCKCDTSSCDAETCNCLCLEIRLRSPPEKVTEFSSNIHPPEPRTAWELAPSRPHQTLRYPVPQAGRSQNLALDLEWARSSSRRFRYSTRSGRSLDTGQEEVPADIMATSTPRQYYGRIEVYDRPGVFSNGRVGFRRQSSKRRSASRSRSPHSRRSSRVLRSRHPYSRSSEHLSQTNETVQRRLFMTPPSTFPY